MSAKPLGCGARYSGIMEAMGEAWTDQKLDTLNHNVDRLEQKVDERFAWADHRFDEVDRRLSRVEETLETRLGSLEDRFAAYQRAMLQMSVLVIAALMGIIATQI
jgi:hypothetical protein